MKRLNIVHLDDHKLFQEGVRRCLEPELSNICLQAFQHSDDAFLSIKNSLDSGQPVDLIITDFLHLGQNGYEFARSVRRYEATFLIRIPIILLTMHSKHELISRGMKERVFDLHLLKYATREEICEAVERLTDFRRSVLQEQ